METEPQYVYTDPELASLRKTLESLGYCMFVGGGIPTDIGILVQALKCIYFTVGELVFITFDHNSQMFIATSVYFWRANDGTIEKRYSDMRRQFIGKEMATVGLWYKGRIFASNLHITPRLLAGLV